MNISCDLSSSNGRYLLRLIVLRYCALKATPINMQWSLIWGTYALQVSTGSYDHCRSNQNIFCLKGESAVDQSTISRWFEKFSSGCKTFDNQARSSRPKRVDSKPMLQVIKANLMNRNQRVSGEFGISQSTVDSHLRNFRKNPLILPPAMGK